MLNHANALRCIKQNKLSVDIIDSNFEKVRYEKTNGEKMVGFPVDPSMLIAHVLLADYYDL